jgi:hypothetical protein
MSTFTREQRAARKAAEFLSERWGLRFSLAQGFASGGNVFSPKDSTVAAGLEVLDKRVNDLSTRLDEVEK